MFDIFSIIRGRQYVKLYTVRNPTTANSIDKMRQYFADVERPETILTDYGKAFTSRYWQEWLQEEGIQHVLILKRHPQVNLAERINRKVVRMLRTYCHNQQVNCKQYLEFIQDVLNATPHETTGFTPNEIQLGQKARYVWDEFFPHNGQDRRVETR